jgi:hypothetical protein
MGVVSGPRFYPNHYLVFLSFAKYAGSFVCQEERYDAYLIDAEYWGEKAVFLVDGGASNFGNKRLEDLNEVLDKPWCCVPLLLGLHSLLGIQAVTKPLDHLPLPNGVGENEPLTF